MRRCVIVGGAPIERAEELRAYLRADDYMIYCDCGLRHEKAFGRAPELIVGDFDSHEDPHAAAETIVLPRVKDDTDSFFAAKEALHRGFRDFLLQKGADVTWDEGDFGHDWDFWDLQIRKVLDWLPL